MLQASDSKWVYLYQKKPNKCTQFNISVFLIVQLDESPFVNGKITHKITIVPTANLTVSCTVSNEFGADSKVINVSSLFEDVRVHKQDQLEDSDQTKLVIGVVVGVLVALVVIGLAYWVYMKKSKQGSWKTGEKESGSSEEEKKLEEKVEENSQKAEV